jgi:hypothetical protein
VTRLAGHGLRHGGRVMDTYGRYHNGQGKGRCECGWESEPLPTTAARQRAHREHKEAIRGE